MKTTKLTVAKVCHELANHLSILAFIKEDLSNSDQPEVKEIVDTVDILMSTMDFFRNIYATKVDPSAVLASIEKIYEQKGIKIFDTNGVFMSLTDNLQNAISGILYLIMKVSKPGDVVDVSRKPFGVMIDLPRGRMLQKNVSDTLTEQEVESNVFNVFANYLKYFLDSEGCKVTTEMAVLNQRIMIWKR